MRTACVLAVSALSVVLLAASGTASVRPAKLDVLRESPLVVKGARFASGERVTVVLVSGGRRSEQVTANRQGTFTLRFDVSLDACAGFALHAFGSKGSRARTLHATRTACTDTPQE